MASIVLLFICLLIGILLRYVKGIPNNFVTSLNTYVINVALPAMALYYIPKVELGLESLLPIGIAWISFAFAFIFYFFLGKMFGWSKKLVGCLILCTGLSNTSFVGFPVIESLYGDEGLKTAVLVDQPGSFIVVSTLGVWIAIQMSNFKRNENTLWGKILRFPPFIMFIVGITMNILEIDSPDYLQSAIKKIADTITPVALVSVGYQLIWVRRSKHTPYLLLGLLFKLMILPSIFYFLYKILLGKNGLVVDVSIMESAMSPMITAAILASNYGLKPKLSAQMVGVGVPLSFITLAFWYYILSNF